MAVNRYMQGALVRVSTTFTDAAGALGDPSTVTLKYRVKGGTVTTIVAPDARIVKDSTGKYHADIDTTALAGTLRYRWEGAGTIVAADEAEFFVTPTDLA